MTTEAIRSNAEVGDGAPVAAPAGVLLSAGARGSIFLWLGGLIILLGFGGPTGWLIGQPISFFLKNKLHLSAEQLAVFGAITHIPLYLGFLFGLARDRWNLFGLKDRGLLIVFGSAGAALYVLFAYAPPTYASLLAAQLLILIAFLFVLAAFNGVLASLGQQHVMTGRTTVVWLVVSGLPAFAAMLLGGSLSDALEGKNAAEAARLLFLIGAGVMASVALYGLWRPRVVFDNLHVERPEVRFVDDIKRLARSWPVWIALIIWSLWTFAPGGLTPLQYFLQNHLHAKDSQWGEWNAIFGACFIPTYLLYGFLCTRFPLRKLLVWGTIVGVPQFIPLLFTPTIGAALWAAAPIGLMGGLASAAYYDLIIRSCPRGLQGTMLMAAAAVYQIVYRGGDLLGTRLYDRFHGFTVCVIAITVVYALILPTLLLVPKSITATADGQIAKA
ncbi:MAG TPA: MFS transporter [Caulobacteraceae bacterium]|nr:MFS transporter [Caulobacteraceae bacterium]